MPISLTHIREIMARTLRNIFTECFEKIHDYPRVPWYGVRWNQMYYEERARVLHKMMTGE